MGSIIQAKLDLIRELTSSFDVAEPNSKINRHRDVILGFKGTRKVITNNDFLNIAAFKGTERHVHEGLSSPESDQRSVLASWENLQGASSLREVTSWSM